MTTTKLSLVATALLLLACPAPEATPPDDDVGDTDGGDTTDDGTTETGDECIGPDGCFACEPTTPAELLDACTDASCEAFPNTPERLPLLERDSGLPPLP